MISAIFRYSIPTASSVNLTVSEFRFQETEKYEQPVRKKKGKIIYKPTIIDTKRENGQLCVTSRDRTWKKMEEERFFEWDREKRA